MRGLCLFRHLLAFPVDHLTSRERERVLLCLFEREMFLLRAYDREKFGDRQVIELKLEDWAGNLSKQVGETAAGSDRGPAVPSFTRRIAASSSARVPCFRATSPVSGL